MKGTLFSGTCVTKKLTFHLTDTYITSICSHQAYKLYKLYYTYSVGATALGVNVIPINCPQSTKAQE